MAEPTQLYRLDSPDPRLSVGYVSCWLHVLSPELLDVAEAFEGVAYINRIPGRDNIALVYFSPLYDYEVVWCELDDALKDASRYQYTWKHALD